MFFFWPCGKSRKTIRMNFNNILVSFVIVLFADIEVLINFDPLQYLPKIIVDNYDDIVEHVHYHLLLFVFVDVDHLELLQELSLIDVNRSLLGPELLL